MDAIPQRIGECTSTLSVDTAVHETEVLERAEMATISQRIGKRTSPVVIDEVPVEMEVLD